MPAHRWVSYFHKIYGTISTDLFPPRFLRARFFIYHFSQTFTSSCRRPYSVRLCALRVIKFSAAVASPSIYSLEHRLASFSATAGNEEGRFYFFSSALMISSAEAVNSSANFSLAILNNSSVPRSVSSNSLFKKPARY